jgi:hypothetical protein
MLRNSGQPPSSGSLRSPPSPAVRERGNANPSPAPRTAFRGNQIAPAERVDLAPASPQVVMAGLVPAIHAVLPRQALKILRNGAAWMPGTRPGMTSSSGRDMKFCNHFRFPGQPCAPRETVARAQPAPGDGDAADEAAWL